MILIIVKVNDLKLNTNLTSKYVNLLRGFEFPLGWEKIGPVVKPKYSNSACYTNNI